MWSRRRIFLLGVIIYIHLFAISDAVSESVKRSSEGAAVNEDDKKSSGDEAATNENDKQNSDDDPARNKDDKQNSDGDAAGNDDGKHSTSEDASASIDDEQTVKRAGDEAANKTVTSNSTGDRAANETESHNSDDGSDKDQTDEQENVSETGTSYEEYSDDPYHPFQAKDGPVLPLQIKIKKRRFNPQNNYLRNNSPVPPNYQQNDRWMEGRYGAPIPNGNSNLEIRSPDSVNTRTFSSRPVGTDPIPYPNNAPNYPNGFYPGPYNADFQGQPGPPQNNLGPFYSNPFNGPNNYFPNRVPATAGQKTENYISSPLVPNAPGLMKLIPINSYEPPNFHPNQHKIAHYVPVQKYPGLKSPNYPGLRTAAPSLNSPNPLGSALFDKLQKPNLMVTDNPNDQRYQAYNRENQITASVDEIKRDFEALIHKNMNQHNNGPAMNVVQNLNITDVYVPNSRPNFQQQPGLDEWRQQQLQGQIPLHQKPSLDKLRQQQLLGQILPQQRPDLDKLRQQQFQGQNPLHQQPGLDKLRQQQLQYQIPSQQRPNLAILGQQQKLNHISHQIQNPNPYNHYPIFQNQAQQNQYIFQQRQNLNRINQNPYSANPKQYLYHQPIQNPYLHNNYINSQNQAQESQVHSPQNLNILGQDAQSAQLQIQQPEREAESPDPTVNPQTQESTASTIDPQTQEPPVSTIDPQIQDPSNSTVDPQTQEPTSSTVDPQNQEPNNSTLDLQTQEPTSSTVDPQPQNPVSETPTKPKDDSSSSEDTIPTTRVLDMQTILEVKQKDNLGYLTSFFSQFLTIFAGKRKEERLALIKGFELDFARLARTGIFYEFPHIEPSMRKGFRTLANYTSEQMKAEARNLSERFRNRYDMMEPEVNDLYNKLDDAFSTSQGNQLLMNLIAVNNFKMRGNTTAEQVATNIVYSLMAPLPDKPMAIRLGWIRKINKILQRKYPYAKRRHNNQSKIGKGLEQKKAYRNESQNLRQKKVVDMLKDMDDVIVKIKIAEEDMLNKYNSKRRRPKKEQRIKTNRGNGKKQHKIIRDEKLQNNRPKQHNKLKQRRDNKLNFDSTPTGTNSNYENIETDGDTYNKVIKNMKLDTKEISVRKSNLAINKQQKEKSTNPTIGIRSINNANDIVKENIDKNKVGSNKNIKEESSYNNEEEEFNFKLSDVIRHSDFDFNNYTNYRRTEADRVVNVRVKINEASSYSDEEGLFKKNIYKVFGYDADLKIN